MPRSVTVLTESNLRRAVPLDLAAIDVIERAFLSLAGDGVVMPPILSMEMPEVHGEVDVKTAYLPDFDSFAIKVSPGFFENPKIGLPSLNGLMILFSARTGLVEALLMDNGYLTDVRTAAAGAVAARHLAPEVDTAGVLGTGVQARMQLEALHLVKPFRRALIWGRDGEKARRAAEDLSRTLSVEAVAVAEACEAVAESQVVVTTTPSRQPILLADWLHPGLHITAMGSDQAGKNEVDPEVMRRADLVVADRVSQCTLLGELRSAISAGTLDAGAVPELGQVVAGYAPGRTGDDQITICDLTGTGAQDTAIATHALSAAEGLATRIEV